MSFHDLQRDVSTEARIPGAVHLSHAARANCFDDLIWS